MLDRYFRNPNPNPFQSERSLCGSFQVQDSKQAESCDVGKDFLGYLCMSGWVLIGTGAAMVMWSDRRNNIEDDLAHTFLTLKLQV